MKREQTSLKNVKRILLIILSIFMCILMILVTFINIHINRKVDLHYCPQNIILLIGDGMGTDHILATKKELKKETMSMEEFPIHGKVSTFSKGFKTTDSAAAGSAMSTGKKTWNSVIAQEKNGVTNDTLIEKAIECGKSTGIITTAELYDATPAVFSSHTDSRNKHDEIIVQQINGSIDLLIGEGKRKYEEYIKKTNYIDKLFIDEISKLPSDSNQKIICAVEEIPAYKDEKNILLLCAQYALKTLSAKNNGFILIVEGAKIDKESHENNIQAMIQELNAFDETVKYCLDFAKNNANTCVMVTADHETGGLSVDKNDTIRNDLYSSDKHTNRLVDYYFYPADVAEIPYIIDNTYIFRLLAQIICDS